MIDVMLARTFHEMDYIPPGTPLSDETVVRLMRMFRAFGTKDRHTGDWIEIDGYDKRDVHVIPINDANRLVSGYVPAAELASKAEASRRTRRVWPYR